MPDDLKPYRMVRVVGQAEFESVCCGLMEKGYMPAGGPTMMPVVHPITQQQAIGFFQAMYRPRSRPDLKIY
jgi:hypothetical protein